ncbi:MAG: N-acetyl-gamma-glutamyl-phosphate reductase [Taibaiella sp.]|nr:N-acetyl-gamma-glutamyl-phosphate reductase [Taibaiella sp.]
MQKIKAGIVGGAGYTGGEMLRILLQHQYVDVVFVHSRSNGGVPVHKVHSDLVGDTDLCFATKINDDIDVLFLCVGHGEASAFLEKNVVKGTVKIIDLSQDFRLNNDSAKAGRQFIYGLPEYNRDYIKTAENIANPGCFATAIQLALLPLAKDGLINEVHISGITGSTGAGQKLQNSSHFSRRVNNIEAYKSLSHQHINEIRETLSTLQTQLPEINFIPWRGDFARGIYISAYTVFNDSIEAAYELYEAYYKEAVFTHVSREMIDMKQVVNTNKCLIHLQKEGNKLIVHAAIDNLLKGASGQAVQNMNIRFDLPEDAGLRLKANAF